MITHSNINKMDNKYIQVVSWPKAQVDNRPLVYDCFMFFNELDILEIRFNILDHVVDRFVVVEADVTNTGKKKELIFTKNKNRFKQFNDKIIHLVYSPLADGSDISSYPRWYLENTQRDAIIVGLALCRQDDVILVSDVDEIPDPDVIIANKDTPGIKVFQQSWMNYYLNFLCWTNPVWSGTRMGRYSDLLNPRQELRRVEAAYTAKGLPTYFRFCHGTNLANAGWHFSYCGGAKAVRIKKGSIVEGNDYNGDLDENAISEYTRKGRAILGIPLFFKPISLDKLPLYIREHVDRYKELILYQSEHEKKLFKSYHRKNIINYYLCYLPRTIKRAFKFFIKIIRWLFSKEPMPTTLYNLIQRISK